MKHKAFLSIFYLVIAFPILSAEPPRFDLREGDRVVLLGNTMIEREQLVGTWEMMLTRRLPKDRLLVRNLGWSGDTVFGDARAGFGSVADGFRKLIEQVNSVQPTVILIAYGSNEAFEGPAGLPRFEQGLNTLLDRLSTTTKARLILVGPIRQEDLGRPYPVPGKQNENLQRYSDSIRHVAEQRKLFFIDLFSLTSAELQNLTENGIHLTPSGYARTALMLEEALGWKAPNWMVDLDAQTGQVTAQGANVERKMPRAFLLTDKQLPLGKDDPARRIMRVHNLPPGEFQLSIDGQAIVTASNEAWSAGISLMRGPSFAQAELLREVIRKKNELFFHRWRPQNETYLFGFRKHEQGKNAAEVPQFDPLVAAEEDKIANLKMPRSQMYEIKPIANKNR